MKTWLNSYLRKKGNNIDGNAHSSKKVPGFTESKMTETERRGWREDRESGKLTCVLKLTCTPATSQVTSLRKGMLNDKQVETEVIIQITPEVFKTNLYIIMVN